MTPALETAHTWYATVRDTLARDGLLLEMTEATAAGHSSLGIHAVNGEHFARMIITDDGYIQVDSRETGRRCDFGVPRQMPFEEGVAQLLAGARYPW